MLKRIWWILSGWLSLGAMSPVQAHVKWFLSESEARLLSLPKPDLFTQIRPDNSLCVMAALFTLFAVQRLNERFKNSKLDRLILKSAPRLDPYIQCLTGIVCGALLVYCSVNMMFFVPNLHLHACCKWIACTEAVIGVAFILGSLTRPAAAAMLMLLLYSFVKFPAADCADLLPLYGVAIYILCAGRGKFSLDHLLGLGGSPASTALGLPIGTLIMRVALGVGLIGLSLDEKLAHPQLALNLLQQHRELNFMLFCGCSNELFILLSGLVEMAVGTCLILGIFPRLCVSFLIFMFSASTLIFGGAELFGHLPYYAVCAAVFVRGAHGMRQLQSLTAWLSGALKPMPRKEALEMLSVSSSRLETWSLH